MHICANISRSAADMLNWQKVIVTGEVPPPLYSHTLMDLGKYLVVHGGYFGAALSPRTYALSTGAPI